MPSYHKYIAPLRAGALLTWLMLLIVEARAPRSISDIVTPHVFLVLALALFALPGEHRLSYAARRAFILAALVLIVWFACIIPGSDPLSRYIIGFVGITVAVYLAKAYL